jgi:hypothetical protein
MIQCPQCKHENDDRDRRPRRCEECGADLQAIQATSSPALEQAEIESQVPVDVDKSPAPEAVPFQEQMEEALEDGIVDREEFQELKQADHSGPVSEDPISEATLTPNEMVFLEKAREAWADDKLTVEEVKELAQLKDSLEISDVRVSELHSIAMESSGSAEMDDADPDESVSGTRPRLTLGINVNQFYMEGFKGILDLKLENGGLDDIGSVKVEVSSDLLTQTGTWNCRLSSGRAVYKKFQVRADLAGIELIEFRIAAHAGDQVHAYWTETDIPVFERTQDLRNISIQADNIVGVGSVADNAKSMGNAVRGQMDALIRMDKIKNATDLMREYRKMTPSYHRLTLEHDPGRSRELSEAVAAKLAPQEKRIVQPTRGSLAESASLAIKGIDRPVNVLLLAKPEVHLGKHRSTDIVTRILPRSSARDEQSNRMSRRHCRIELAAQGLLITDNQTANGTCLDGELLVAEQQLLGATSRVIELAGVLALEVFLAQGPGSAENRAQYDKLAQTCLGEMWESAARHDINALTLRRCDNLGQEDTNGFERYCLIYRWATLGSDGQCSICISDKGLEPIHAALVYLNSRFYLENLSDHSSVFVNDTVLAKGELIPLSFGDSLRIERLEMEFAQAQQIGIG